MSTKRTYHGSKKRRATTHGFRCRMKSYEGRKVIKRRILKGRVKKTP